MNTQEKLPSLRPTEPAAPPAGPRGRRRVAAWGRALLAVAAVLALIAVTALPAEAQASRTRPPDQGTSAGSSGSSGGSVGSRPSGGSSSGAGTVHRPPTRSSGGAVYTRPPGSSGGSPTVIDRDRRPPRGSGGGGYYYPYYPRYNHYYDYYSWSPFRYSWWLGYWGWYGWDAYPYYPYPHYGYGPYGRVVHYPSRVRADMGGLDLDLKPGDTKIYVNGQFLGTADNFDGWPQYLWLEEGNYHFIFYKEGHRSIVREYRVYPGVVIDVEDRLERGESPPPEELFPPPTERRDERLRRYDEQRRRVEREGAGDWRERSEAIRSRPEPEDRDEVGREAAPAPAGDFGSLDLTVEPDDASIYLDGRFLGTAADLARLRRGLTVDAGEHTLSVVRPGYEAEEIRFDVEAGEAVRLDVRLDRP